jgi:5-hydroxyisourate hydrolase-like protein (transthyretin family)
VVKCEITHHILDRSDGVVAVEVKVEVEVTNNSSSSSSKVEVEEQRQWPPSEGSDAAI